MANGRIKTASFGPAFIGVVLIFCAFAVVAWILFWFAAPVSTYEEKRADNRLAKSSAIAQEAQDKLYSPAKWIDKTKGTVQLPIDTAMDLVVADYQTKVVHPSGVKVENPYPIGLGAIMPGAVAASGTAATTGTAAATSGTAAATSGTTAATSGTSTPVTTGTAKPATSPATPEVKP